MDPIQELTDKLARHPELSFSATPTSVTVAPPSSGGFSVSFHASPQGYVLHFDGWHEHFDSADQALECFAFAYSGECRLAITYRGRMPVKWVLEYMEADRWQVDSEVGHFLIPFWLRPHVVYKQNPNLLSAALTAACPWRRFSSTECRFCSSGQLAAADARSVRPQNRGNHMHPDLLPRVVLTAVVVGVAGYLAFDLYSQPRATYRHIEPVRTFLSHALAGDSAALVAEAGDQPIRWVSTAVRLDSAAVREWAESRPRVTTILRRDTLWVTLRRPGSTDRCSPLYPLTAGFLEDRGDLRLVHLSSSCPSISRAVKP